MSTKRKRSIIIASESPELYTSKRLISEAIKLKYSASWLNPYQHFLSINENPNHKKKDDLYLHRTTGIRYDNFDLLVSKSHEMKGFKVTNPLPSLNLFRDKDLQALFFHQNKVNSIKTISYRGHLDEQCWDKISSLSTNEKYIIKMNRGNQGIGVNLVNGLHSLKSLLETFHAIKDQKFVIQPFIEHKKEWRVFVVKNKIISIVERTITPKDFRGNSKRSNGKIITKIPTEIETEIVRCAQLSGLDYCGIDILIDSKRYYFLEFNPVPGFEQIENISNQNIAKEILTQI